ncbi:BnaC03g60470D [Brassica napus]|uniref:Protein RER1 n=2 Tax=Brassica TaxID=3705 RepID=A0A3P6BRQ1_BRAOL|nr:unnamed protein product [Brassica napus]CDY12131.1 BnaC03g60470D [Brassica napus]VDC98418.1 unnamed protein product [Brassica oleracea]
MKFKNLIVNIQGVKLISIKRLGSNQIKKNKTRIKIHLLHFACCVFRQICSFFWISISSSSMDGGGGDSGSVATPVQQKAHEAWRIYQHYLDKTTPHATYRWIGTLVVALAYCLRVYYIQGFYIIAYGLGIYLLNLLIGFLSPLVDPEAAGGSDGPSLPTRGSDEFKPFIRRLPEFKFWYSMTKAFCIAFVMTFFSVFDVPVFWPILLCYWIVLFVLTMRRQISHMIKYKYIPFSFGKQKYGGRSGSGPRAD